jgi:hypothetical protein
MFWAITIVNIVGWQIIYRGTGSKIRSAEFWYTCATIAGGIWLVIGLLQRMAVALISPPTSNRMLPVRRYIALVWLISGIVAYAYASYTSEEYMLLVWFIPAMVFLSGVILFGLGERSALSRRIIHSIPRRRLPRILAFPFYNGPASAMIFSMILMLISIVAVNLAAPSITSSIDSDFTDAVFGTVCFSIYALAYGLAALTIWRKYLSRRLQPAVIGVLACLLIAIGSMLPSIAALITNSGVSWEPAWHVGNIFTVWNSHYSTSHFAFSIMFAAIFLIINYTWIRKQISNFRPSSHE